jgi:hypothetical protein
MKRLWTNDDLVVQWILQPNELALLEYKEDANRLGFALLLKYFQIDGRFPRQKHDVPVPAITFVANQLESRSTSIRHTTGMDGPSNSIGPTFAPSWAFANRPSKTTTR